MTDTKGTAMSTSTASIPDGPDDDFLTLSEVAAILRVPVNTLRWWRQRGQGPRFFKIGRRLVTTIGDLRRWIEEQKQTSSTGVA
jgi:helix-turn-helix protein